MNTSEDTNLVKMIDDLLEILGKDLCHFVPKLIYMNKIEIIKYSLEKKLIKDSDLCYFLECATENNHPELVEIFWEKYFSLMKKSLIGE